MASNNTAVSPLLTELFRYTPLTFIDDVINTVNELTYRAVDAVESGLLSTPPSALGFGDDSSTGKAQAKSEIENGVHQLETLLQTSVDSNFDKLELYVLRNSMAIQEKDLEKWIRLPHYDGLDFSPPRQGEATKETLLRSRQKLTESRKLHSLLETEKKRNERVLNDLRALLDPSRSNTEQQSLAFLSKEAISTGTGSSEPLTAQTQTLIRSLPQLRTALNALREHLASPTVTTLQPRPGASAANERRDYLEEAVKRKIVAAMPAADPATGEGLHGNAAKLGAGDVEMDVGAIENAASLLETTGELRDSEMAE